MRLCCWREDLEKWKLRISGSLTGVEDCDFDEVWRICGVGCWMLEMTATDSDGCWRRGEIEPLMLTVELLWVALPAPAGGRGSVVTVSTGAVARLTVVVAAGLFLDDEWWAAVI
ncbi:hypothetical protein NC651_009310 [Populus alba x Populus x berolinensis]|nr:hypothetical protein NC651_009310 [Populus alba x Populus x berolinensis]